MWTEQFQSMLVLMVMAALLRASYEMSRPKATHSEEVSAFADARPNSVASKPVAFTHQQREWPDKAVKRYAEVQEKKWRNWNDAMFEQAK